MPKYISRHPDVCLLLLLLLLLFLKATGYTTLDIIIIIMVRYNNEIVTKGKLII